MSATSGYALGYSTEEERRLALQARMFERLTEDVLHHAGIREGMDVLDIGCGVGDVSFLAARLVGPRGSVVGVDRGDESVETARRRAKGLGLENVTFVSADVSNFETDQIFDAVVGRLVLLYLSDPSTILRRLSSHLRPGGVMAFQEMDMSTFLQPGSPALRTRVLTWVYEAFGATGAQREMGPRLPDIFMKAGLPRPEMIAGQRMTGGSRTLTCTLSSQASPEAFCQLWSAQKSGRPKRSTSIRCRKDCVPKQSKRANLSSTGPAWLARGRGKPEAALGSLGQSEVDVRAQADHELVFDPLRRSVRVGDP
jgi:ubiquinone/menaquinone biosynthesis C-methylase UbiE